VKPILPVRVTVSFTALMEKAYLAVGRFYSSVMAGRFGTGYRADATADIRFAMENRVISDPNNQRAGLAITAESTSIVTDSNIYYGLEVTWSYNIDKTTHKAPCGFSRPRNNITSSPALANNVIYIGSSDGYLYAIDAQSGTQTLGLRCRGTIISSPAQATG